MSLWSYLAKKYDHLNVWVVFIPQNVLDKCWARVPRTTITTQYLLSVRIFLLVLIVELRESLAMAQLLRNHSVSIDSGGTRVNNTYEFKIWVVASLIYIVYSNQSGEETLEMWGHPRVADFHRQFPVAFFIDIVSLWTVEEFNPRPLIGTCSPIRLQFLKNRIKTSACKWDLEIHGCFKSS